MKLENKVQSVLHKVGELAHVYSDFEKIRKMVYADPLNARLDLEMELAENKVKQSVALLCDLLDSLSGFGSDLDKLMDITSKVQIDKITMSKR